MKKNKSKIHIYSCLSKLKRAKWENIEIASVEQAKPLFLKKNNNNNNKLDLENSEDVLFETSQRANFAFVPVFLHTQEVKESLVTLKMYVTTQMYIHQTN